MLFAACSDNPNEKEYFINPVQHQLSESLNMAKDRLFVESRDSVFVVSLTRTHRIEILNADTGFKVVFDTPPGVDAFHMHNRDSIYLFHTREQVIYLCDQSGAVENRHIIPSFDGLSHRLVVSPWNRPIIRKDEMFISVLPYTTLENFYNYYCEYRYRMINGDGQSFLKYPTCYSGNQWWHVIGNEFSKAEHPDGRIVYSFPMSDSLCIADTETMKVETRPAASVYFDEFPPQPYEESNQRALIEYVATIPMYKQLLYDPYRRLFYRVVLHGQSTTTSDDDKNYGKDRPWSIIIMNSDFVILGEQAFSERLYDFNQIFVCSAGLCMVDRRRKARATPPDSVLTYTVYEVVL